MPCTPKVSAEVSQVSEKDAISAHGLWGMGTIFLACKAEVVSISGL